MTPNIYKKMSAGIKVCLNSFYSFFGKESNGIADYWLDKNHKWILHSSSTPYQSTTYKY